MSDPSSGEGATFIDHLIEFRNRVIRMFLSITLIFLALFPFANTLYTLLAQPLLTLLPDNTSMIATEVASPFLTPLKLTLVLALFLDIPYLLYQIWLFVMPALYQHEKRLIVPLLISSTLLFYVGMAFAYFLVFPLIFGFFTSVAPEGVAVMTDISHYLDFVLTIFFAFGVAFEVPVVVVLLIILGITTAEDLAQQRRYVIVGAFFIGMILTPPDIFSQTLLAIPMWLLFEAGLWSSRYFQQVLTPEEPPIAPPPPPPTPTTEAEMEALLDRYEADELTVKRLNEPK